MLLCFYFLEDVPVDKALWAPAVAKNSAMVCG
jgi:hypothetical protein